jgi:nicotinamide-nucleotide amidase
MAENAREKFGTTWALATSGIAGPDGGTAEKPVGTVWIALAGENGTEAQKFAFGRERVRNIQKSATAALEMLRAALIKKY